MIHYPIYLLNKRGENQTRIAETIGVHKSTVCRELKRNKGGRGYRYKQVHRFAIKRRKCKANKRITDENWGKVEELIEKEWGPEQISERFQKEDNGKEFSQHEKLAEELEVDVYFAHPYSSWERGLDENTNGLIRQYFPKGRKLLEVDQEELENTAERLNHRPRKSLDHRTPHEAYYGTTEGLTVALTC